MKITKMKENPFCSSQMSRIIEALMTARRAAADVDDSGDFQQRCLKAVMTLGDRLLTEYVEPHYAPETKKFFVTYDVKRSGSHTMEVEAETEAEAKRIAQHRLDDTDERCMEDKATEIVALEVIDAKEIPV